MTTQAQARKEREELDMMLKENSRRVEESQRREALEQQKKDEERFCELELIKRQKEEVAWRKKAGSRRRSCKPEEPVG
ncbi:hypothetical protein OIU76_024089 [Salix suchowensis]|nr:hypothetical protein OIU76_024089 [Salix suchowensis]